MTRAPPMLLSRDTGGRAVGRVRQVLERHSAVWTLRRLLSWGLDPCLTLRYGVDIANETGELMSFN